MGERRLARIRFSQLVDGTISIADLGWNIRAGWPRVVLLDGEVWLYRTRMTPRGALYESEGGAWRAEVLR
jgi:hypothetical protein